LHQKCKRFPNLIAIHFKGIQSKPFFTTKNGNHLQRLSGLSRAPLHLFRRREALRGTFIRRQNYSRNSADEGGSFSSIPPAIFTLSRLDPATLCGR
jgi:hypothetical protein